MPRRAAHHTQADIARVIRAYRNEGVEVRTRLMPDGSTAIEPIDKAADRGDDDEAAAAREIVL